MSQTHTLTIKPREALPKKEGLIFYRFNVFVSLHIIINLYIYIYFIIFKETTSGLIAPIINKDFVFVCLSLTFVINLN